MNTPVVGTLIYSHGQFSDGVPGLYPWKIQWWGAWFTLLDTPVVAPWFTP